MANLKLSEIVMRNLHFLTGNSSYFAGKENVLKYFLERDFKKIIGKDDFFLDSENKIEIIKINRNSKKTIDFKYYGNSYEISYNNNQIIIKDFNNDMVAKIEDQENVLKNHIIYNEDGVKHIQVQNIYTSNEKIFEYCQTIVENERIIEYPPYRMRPIGSKKQNVEHFSLTTLEQGNENKNIIQKFLSLFKDDTIVGVITDYKNCDIFDYTDRIYEVIEENINNNDNLSKKR